MLTKNRGGFGPPAGRPGWTFGFGLRGWVASLALAIAGCSSDREPRDHLVSHPPPPPAFLSGPAGALLAGGSGFSARVAMPALPDASGKRAVSGTLLGRGEWLVFSPDTNKKERKRAGSSGFGYIWNLSAGQGWLLSDALQAYAPLASAVHFTNVTYAAAGSPPASIDGRTCREELATVMASDGSTNVVRVWRSGELNGIPARITGGPGGPSLEVTLSQVRLEAPSLAVFQPPDGFTKYPTAEALMDELLAREGNSRRGMSEPGFDPAMDRLGARGGFH
jgi:hypothetical protein